MPREPTLDADTRDSIRKTYVRFARHEAHGVSATYEAFALAVAADDSLLQFLGALPQPKRQPNLLFAAVRHLTGVPSSAEAFVAYATQHGDAVRRVMLTHSTQTNEPARCATLLPVLSRLRQPIALVEVGAAAGLCLLPDRYAYRYNDGPTLGASSAGAPVFPCTANATTPIPARVPHVAWRAGLDLNPVDPTNDKHVDWLETLIWPEQHDRVARLRAALRIAARDRPAVHSGDLLTDLAALADTAPADATLVVFHSAVLGYVADRAARARFPEQVRELDAVWISNEAPGVFPEFLDGGQAPRNRFLLAVDGVPVAATGPHGQSIDWL